MVYHDWQSNLLLEQYRFQPELEVGDQNIQRSINLHRQELLCIKRLITVLSELIKSQNKFLENANAGLRILEEYATLCRMTDRAEEAKRMEDRAAGIRSNSQHQ